MSKPIITVFTRTGCHLCEEATDLAGRIAAEAGVNYQAIDVDTDSELRAEYGDRVPVVLVQEREIGHFRIAEATLRSELAKVLH